MKDIKDCEECKTIKLGEPRCRYCLTDLLIEGFAKLKEAKRDSERLDFILKNRPVCVVKNAEFYPHDRDCIDEAMKEGGK